MTNVTTIGPQKSPSEVTASDVTNSVIRAKQIIRAVYTAQQHDNDCDYVYALEAAEDMLAWASEAMSVMEDRLRRPPPSRVP